jgi:hypothetical protein
MVVCDKRARFGVGAAPFTSHGASRQARLAAQGRDGEDFRFPLFPVVVFSSVVVVVVVSEIVVKVAATSSKTTYELLPMATYEAAWPLTSPVAYEAYHLSTLATIPCQSVAF